MAAPLHREYARKGDLPPTHCGGRIRTIFARVGAGKYYVRIGKICDRCSAVTLDDDRYERIEAHVVRERQAAGKGPRKRRPPSSSS